MASLQMTNILRIKSLAAIAGLGILAGCAAIPAAEVGSAQTAPVQAPAVAEIVRLSSGDRTLELSVYRPGQEAVGVLLLSHGGGNSPEGMRSLTDRLTDEGFVVLAPAHTDSPAVPEEERTDVIGAFPTRTADLKAVSDYARETFSELPYGGIGYSYGSLTSMIGVGVLQPMLNGAVPEMKSVVAFSTPGVIPGLMDGEAAFGSVSKPTLLITGTADVVGTFVPDAKQHLAYFERPPEGGHMLLLVKDGTHRFVGGNEPGFSEVWPVVVDFLKATVLDDADARASLSAAQSTELVEIRRR